MNFSMRNFIKSGFLKAVGKMGDYWVILNAAGWYEKGVLLEEDLAEIQSAIDARNAETVAPTESSSDDEPKPPTESSSDDESENPSGDATPENT